MNRQFKILVWSTIISIVFLATLSCNKDNIRKRTLKKLYKTYKNGEINECKYNGQTVYSAGLNANDAGSVVFDKKGKQIGQCNYAWGSVDDICKQLNDCETVYRVANNIWGQPAVDKYGLDD